MPNELTRTAYHEAGHAVMYFFQFRKFKYATIKPEGLKLGHVLGSGTLTISKLSMTTLVKQVMILYAGQASEEILLNKKLSFQSTGDQEELVAILSSQMDQVEIDLFVRWIYYRTKELLKNRWDAVELVVKALLEKQTLTYNDMVAILLKQPRRDLG